MDPNEKSPHETLLNLLTLRSRNEPDLFMEELFRAITGGLRDWTIPIQPGGKAHSAICQLLLHFQEREEYEKCAALCRLLNECFGKNPNIATQPD